MSIMEMSDDDREALATQYAWTHGDSQTRADFLAGYDAGVRRRQPTTDARLQGSCWDEAPRILVPEGHCAPFPARCELPHGHGGAHRDGSTQWMSRAAAPITDAQVAAAWKAVPDGVLDIADMRTMLEAARDAS